jgi:hypothetical protein
VIATWYYAVLSLIVFATLLHFTERDNPELKRYFQSIPHALYPTLLMLSGEFPLVDFTPLGCVITSFVAIVAGNCNLSSRNICCAYSHYRFWIYKGR